MTAFTVWRFETPEGAAHVQSTLDEADQEQLAAIGEGITEGSSASRAQSRTC